MMKFTQGNLLEAPAEAFVNTVNTVGVMGKGIALMFKEAFPANFRAYEDACKQKEVTVGKMFVTENHALPGRIGLSTSLPRNTGGIPRNWNGLLRGLGIFAGLSRSTRFVPSPCHHSGPATAVLIGARYGLRWNVFWAISKASRSRL